MRLTAFRRQHDGGVGRSQSLFVTLRAYQRVDADQGDLDAFGLERRSCIDGQECRLHIVQTPVCAGAADMSADVGWLDVHDPREIA